VPTQITTATHQDSLSGSSEKRLDIDSAGVLWLAFADTNRVRFYSSSTSGASWEAAAGSDLVYGTGQDTAAPSFYIDADGYAHCTFVRWQQTPQTLVYARGTPRIGGGWEWKTLIVSPAGGRMNVDSDVVAFRNGTGWVAWVTWSYGSTGGSRVSRIDVSASGVLTLATLVHGPASGDAAWQFGALAFASDRKVPQASPHVFLVSSSQTTSSPVYAHRAQYSSGSWTWGSPISVATGVTNPDTTLCCAHDGTRLIIAWSPNSAAVNVSQWDGMAGSATAINPLALSQGTVKGISLSVDPSTADIYLVAHDATNGDVFWTKYTRATTSWTTWASLISRSPNGQDGDVQLVRNPTQDAVDLVYAIGTSPNITVLHAKVATLTRTPSAPQLISPAPGVRVDLAAGGTFVWKHSKVSMSDSQSQWQLRRIDGATTEFWNVATQAWNSGVSFSDDFTTQNGAAWAGYGPNVAVVSGRARITPTSGYPPLLRTGQVLTASSVTVKVPTLPNAGNGTTEALLFFEVSSGNRIQMEWHNGNLKFIETISGAQDTTQITYNGTDHLWWRIREASGTVYWETSPNGSTWTTRRSKSTTLNLASGMAFLSAGFYGTEPSPGFAEFDDFSQGGNDGVWNASAAVAPEQVTFGAGKWTSGTTYSWTVRTKSADGSASPFAADRTVIATAAPVVVVTAPSGIVYDTSTPTVVWTYTSAKPQRDYEVRILDPAAGAIDPNDPIPAVWTSGVVASPVARSVTVSTALPDPAGTYRAYVRCLDNDGIASTWVYSTFSLSAVPPIGPSLSAEAHSPYETAVPRCRLRLTGRCNYLAAAQAAGGTGWDSVSNATVATLTEDSLLGRLAGFSMTTTTSGTSAVRTAAGSPPEAPFGRPALTGPLDFPTVPGLSYTAIASLRAAAGGATRAARVLIEWYSADDGSSPTPLETTTGLQGNVTDAGYIQVVVQAMAPAGAVRARLVVQVLATAAAAEVFYVARISLAPGSSTAWRPGGNAQRQTVRIERSVDDRTTWSQIASGYKTDYWQQMILDDRVVPLGTTVAYRAWSDITEVSGARTVSEASLVAEVVVESPTWTLRDPDEDTAEVLLYVTAYNRTEDDGAVVTWTAGAAYPVVDVEDVRVGGGSVTAYVRRTYVDATSSVLRRAVPLVLSSPVGEVLRIRVLSRSFDAAHPSDREYTVDFAVVT
jgi:hypothetical protein